MRPLVRDRQADTDTESSRSRRAAAADRPQLDAEHTPDPDGDGGAGHDGDETVVRTRTHCGECPHLSDPPGFRCTHDDARIVGLVDRLHVRVRECPVVNNEEASG